MDITKKTYTTKTASLKVTKADIIKLDVKHFTIDGEPIKITIKDERESITENDIWPNPVDAEIKNFTSDANGNVVYQGLTNNTFDYSQMTNTQKDITNTAVKVIDNKVLGTDDELLMNWDTKSFTNSNNSNMYDIFNSSSTITEWNSDLSRLTKGSYMFNACPLTTFNADLSSLTDGGNMFEYCTNLESFNSDLSSLTNGNCMFNNSALESFDSDLSSLTNGSSMFQGCKLDADSLNNIIHTINDISDDTNNENWGWGEIRIGLGYSNTDESKLALAKYCCCDTWNELNLEFSDKGWTVSWQFNGTQSASNILNLLDDNETPSTIIWAKLEEITDENANYEYVIEDDTTKHYNIHWYHESNGDNEGYQQFGSLLEAMGYFGVVPKENSH